MCVGMYVMVMSGKQRNHGFEKEQKIKRSIKSSPFSSLPVIMESIPLLVNSNKIYNYVFVSIQMSE